MSWTEFVKNKSTKKELVVTFLLLVIVLISLTHFLDYVEIRNGVTLPDPILNLFDPIDLTWLTFALIYFSLIIGIISLINNPDILLFTVQLYIFMVIIRIIAMYLLPLNPPDKMIMLKDPVVEFFGSGKTLTKDLFFSGHTATLLILFLVSQKKTIKFIFLIDLIIVATSVLLQHVHYTIDVFAALIFTYACYELLIKMRNKWKKI